MVDPPLSKWPYDWKFFNFCVAHLPVKRDIETKFPISYLGHACQNKGYWNFVTISRLTGKCTAQKLNNFWGSSLWTCLHYMVILRSQNNIKDFFMILAWLCCFNHLSAKLVCFKVWRYNKHNLIPEKIAVSYPAEPSYSHCAELGRSDCHFSTAARVKKTVTPPTDKTVTVLALVS